MASWWPLDTPIKFNKNTIIQSCWGEALTTGMVVVASKSPAKATGHPSVLVICVLSSACGEGSGVTAIPGDTTVIALFRHTLMQEAH